MGEEGNISFEEIAQIEEARRIDESSQLAASYTQAGTGDRSRIGRFAFLVMLSGGLAFLWGYGIISRTLDPTLLGRIQSLIYQTTFSDPTRVLLIALIALVIGLVVRRARSRSNLRLLSD